MSRYFDPEAAPPLGPDVAASPVRGRLLLSSNSLWNIENFRSSLVESLARAGWELVVAAPANEAERERRSESAVPGSILK